MTPSQPDPRPPAPRTPTTSDASTGSGARGVLDVIAFAVGFVVYLYLAGWLIDRVRLSSARLPAYLVSDAFNAQRLIGDGLRTTLLAGAVFALVCVLAYFAVALHWDRNGPFWHEQIARRVRAGTREEEPQAPLGEAAMRILAGLSSVSLAAFVGLMAAQLIDALFPGTAWAVLIAWLVAFLPSLLLIERFAPKIWRPGVGAWLWVLVALLSLLASAPLGVLILATVFVSTFGRVILRLERPDTIRALVRSPLPWAVLAVVMAIALAYNAMPPESFPTAVLTTTGSGPQTVAYLGRTGDGVYTASCNVAQTDATSTEEKVSFTPARAVKSLEVRSEPYRFDSAKRPSLLTLAFHAIGGEGDTPTWFDADLRARASTCDGAGTEGVSNDSSLGKGVEVAPGPDGGRARDGEEPIEDKTAKVIAELARRYEPTVLVTAADRNWPVSLGAVLAERGAGGEKACLRQGERQSCDVTPQDLTPAGAGKADYLQLPVKLEDDSTPEGQFEGFMRGQELEPGPPSRWLANPALLEPWSTAEIYFYLDEAFDMGGLKEKARNPQVQAGMVGLEYWFYYPYNYYPAVVRAKLMEQAPLAGEVLNVDRHQGDWEHVDVLLDPSTFEPKWLYMARHDFEGEFIRWKSAVLDGGHPVVQAAYGGHPTYQPGCGPQARRKAFALLTDWLVCGSGRLGFRGQTTPLVDLASVPWGCWPGHFGEASPLEVARGGASEIVRDTLRKVVFVAGPGAPLRQAENRDVCEAGPQASEEHLLPRLQQVFGKAPAP